MGLSLGAALRLFPERPAQRPSRFDNSIAFVGAGGKTTAIFRLARESHTPVVVTSTTHLGAWQLALADKHVIAKSPRDLESLGRVHLTVVTGRVESDQRTEPVQADVLSALKSKSGEQGFALLIEADGSRQKPLKAPAEHEPPIPAFTEAVIVVAGMSGIGLPLSEANVHRPEAFATLSGLQFGEPVTAEGLARVLVHPRGGLRNIPPGARKVVLLNQADTPDLQGTARGLARSLLPAFDSVVVSSLREDGIHAVHEPCAGIVLAAGESRRFGRPKQLLTWHEEPFVAVAAAVALEAGLSPVIVVTGAYAEEVEAAVQRLPVTIERNQRWADGQASSIRCGLAACPPTIGSAIFLLADQPQVTPEVVRALAETHAAALHAIVAPLILGERRGNPVLFDRTTFADLRALEGDIGGRGIFPKFRVHYLPWHDERLLLDIDSEADYRRLLESEPQ